jgi:hypothetical protein
MSRCLEHPRKKQGKILSQLNEIELLRSAKEKDLALSIVKPEDYFPA